MENNKRHKIYLDNAATTRVHPDVVRAMTSVLEEDYGNPSSIHGFGRSSRALIEVSRKKIARHLNTSPSNIFFTSGGTEANNMAIRCVINDLGIKHAVTSPLEHHAVLHTLEELGKRDAVELDLVRINDQGHIDYDHLEELLGKNERTLVSLMEANNEIGTLTDIVRVGEICRKYDAIFHSDTVQTMCHFRHDLSALPVDFISCAAHKFHGPKGVGFLYINNEKVQIGPFITGGAQERNMRGGTENIYGIVGLAKAMDIAYENLDRDAEYILGLKKYMIQKFTEEIPGVGFNGDIGDENLFTVLNVSFPPAEFGEMLLYSLDIAGIAASGGSACSSGSNKGSHVLTALGADPSRPAVRFSFCCDNTREEIDYCVSRLREMYLVKA